LPRTITPTRPRPMKTLPALVAALFSIGAWPTGAADAKAPPAPRPKMGSAVFPWEKMIARPTAVGERRDVAHHATPTLAVFECHITTLNPGAASHEPHRHPQEELIIVKEGTLEVHIDGRAQTGGAGSVFFFGSNDLHGLRSAGDTPASYQIIRLVTAATPKP
jgi:quercetin dioxygenase-like cupin family protein